jgi:hypothetical protein
MNINEAHEILGTRQAASPEDISKAYGIKQEGLEQKIFQAPTKALKEKYRKNLRELEQAYQVLQSVGCAPRTIIGLAVTRRTPLCITHPP